MLTAAVDEYRVIDTDTHVIEPYDLWTSRLPVDKWGEKVPHVQWDENFQEDAWYFGTDRVGPAASAAQAGWTEFPPNHPPKLEVVDPATWQVDARLARMVVYGIWSQVLYPNVAGFGAGKVLAIGDPELMLACVRAYNDFLTDYVSADPKRLIPISALPFWDMDLTAREIARCVARGHKGVIMTGEPAYWGMPKIADPHWDPLWAACQDAGLSVNFHIGSGDMSIFDTAYEGAGPHANYAGFGVQFGIGNVRVIANLITGGVCHRFRDLKFVSVESGIGWLPFMLEATDYSWLGAFRPGRERTAEDVLPSELFRQSVYVTYWFEATAPKHFLDVIPLDNILFETDFPHTTCLFGNIQETIEKGIGHLEEGVRRKILWDNAAKLYGIDEPAEEWQRAAAQCITAASAAGAAR